MPRRLDPLDLVTLTADAVLPALRRGLHNPDLADAVADRYRHAVALTATFAEAVTTADVDGNLSADGKTTAAREAKRALLSACQPFRTEAAGVGRHLDQLRGTLARAVAGPALDDRTARLREARDGEIRAQVRDLSLVERDALFLSTTDPDVIRALSSAPPVIGRLHPDALPTVQPFITPALVIEKQAALAALADPSLAAQAEDLAFVQRAYESLAATVATAAGQVVPDSAEDAPLPEMG